MYACFNKGRHSRLVRPVIYDRKSPQYTRPSIELKALLRTGKPSGIISLWTWKALRRNFEILLCVSIYKKCLLAMKVPAHSPNKQVWPIGWIIFHLITDGLEGPSRFRPLVNCRQFRRNWQAELNVDGLSFWLTLSLYLAQGLRRFHFYLRYYPRGLFGLNLHP